MDDKLLPIAILFGGWLGVLTVVTVLLVRQVAVLTLRFSLAVPRFSPGNDGPTIGSALPVEIIPKIPSERGATSGLVLLSATCVPCRKVATEMKALPFTRPITVLLPGRDEPVNGLIGLLPADVRVIRDPDATSIAEALHIESAPFAVAVEDSKIIGKAYLNTAMDLAALMKGTKGAEIEEMEARHAL